MNRSDNDKNRKAENGSFGDNPWRAMGLIGSVGGTIGASLGLGFWIGSKINAEYGGIYGMAAGFIVAAIATILLIRTFTGGNAS
ncbi:hypothetical protein GZH47_18095 [Paenibacillus rhizovicinus]|uniref:AtpZ/AtpI family protein n=1 Tax=Paenibacillus rhizovicinus TaxID=2704463 RepID=A0A6C0P3X1_9BACL|nr:hypothetical protein [Paenibacillus rhizovicinus]QHW32533.1 hypothetical protein GZH47_18095 [Paenibacillus rhizovicinus]